MRKNIVMFILSASILIAPTFSSAMMCGGDHAEHSQHEEKAKEVSQEKSSVKESFYQVVYVCSMHPEVTSDKPGKCPKCGMKLEKKQVLMAYVCPEPQCEYQKASPGECPDDKKELVKVELRTHCPKCGEQVNPEELKLKPVKGGKDEKIR